MDTNSYFEDPVIAEGLLELAKLPAGEEKKEALQRLRLLALERHPGLKQLMSGSAEEFFSALAQKTVETDDDFLAAIEQQVALLSDSEEDFPVLPKN